VGIVERVASVDAYCKANVSSGEKAKSAKKQVLKRTGRHDDSEVILGVQSWGAEREKRMSGESERGKRCLGQVRVKSGRIDRT